MSKQNLSILDLIAPNGEQLKADHRFGGAEQPIVRVGYLPLSDSAPILVATELGFDLKHGIKIIPTCENSWSAVRDHLMSGELDASQALYGMVHAVQAGVLGVQHDLKILMNLNWNGQAITLSRRLFECGVDNGQSLASYIQQIKKQNKKLTFAQTYPTGTHAMWLYYWLESHGITPFEDVNIVVIPPQQMIHYLSSGQIDGYSAGEPWNAMAVEYQIGFTVVTSQHIWADHPEKVLACSRQFTEENPNTVKALMKAILEACQYLDNMENRKIVLPALCDTTALNLPESIVRSRFLGIYDNGIGQTWKDNHPVCFHRDGLVNYPYLSDGLWFLNQFKCLGLLSQTEEQCEMQVQNVHWLNGYQEVAESLNINIPKQPYRKSTLIDGTVWGDNAVTSDIEL